MGTRTRAQLRAAARNEADLSLSSAGTGPLHVSDDELNEKLAVYHADLYGDLAELEAPGYFRTSWCFNVVPGNATSDLPTDFYKLLGIDVSTDQAFSSEDLTALTVGGRPVGEPPARFDDLWCRARPRRFNERHDRRYTNGWRSGRSVFYSLEGAGTPTGRVRWQNRPLAVAAVRYWYVPQPVDLVGVGVEDTITVTYPMKWEELIILRGAKYLRDKQSRDSRVLAEKIAKLEAQVAKQGRETDKGEPKRAKDERWRRGFYHDDDDLGFRWGRP